LDQTNSRSIGKGYAFYINVAFALLGLLVIGTALVAIFYWDLWTAFFKTQSWWIPTLPVLAVGFWIFLFACILKGADDKKTKMRTMAVYEEC
jgi:uncharacterized BrkB/YihY/UPF0761 family membrane protein